MRLITLNKSKPTMTLDFYGCPLHCRYCAHMSREKFDYSFDQVKSILLDYDVKTVIFGGAEPALQKKELLAMIKLMNKAGKEVVLKSVGHDPEFIRETLPFVNKYILEVKVPLDDPAGLAALTGYDEERSMAHLVGMKALLDIVKGKDVMATVRVLPVYYNETRIDRIGKDLEGVVDVVHMTQFLSSPYDLPFGDLIVPAPSAEEMLKLGQSMRLHIPKVRVQGNGFDHWL
jgi:pyruvate-formate lyase-activating enzyme